MRRLPGCEVEEPGAAPTPTTRGLGRARPGGAVRISAAVAAARIDAGAVPRALALLCETGFLLQRIEMHRGVSILATNLLANIDPAFMRRLQIVAEFPMPGADERRRIWLRHLPTDPREIDVALLAERFSIAGGDIRNVCFAAQIAATAAGGPLTMSHVIASLCRELVKLGKLVEAKEFGPWASTAAAWLRPPTR